MRRIISFVAICALSLLAQTAMALVPHYAVQIVKTYPHDTSAFTEGLFYKGGFLYESTGLNGKSFIRKVALDTGKTVSQTAVDKRYFGEGIAPFGNQIFSLTWQSGAGFIWDSKTFRQVRRFSYSGEGWGLTQNGKYLVMSDGTPEIKFLNPTTLKVVKSIQVSLNGRPIDQINELEWVKGELFANIWRTRKIVKIDPESGAITAIIDLDTIVETQDETLAQDAVANGIAYDPAGDHLYITGKLWPHLYEIKLIKP